MTSPSAVLGWLAGRLGLHAYMEQGKQPVKILKGLTQPVSQLGRFRDAVGQRLALNHLQINWIEVEIFTSDFSEPCNTQSDEHSAQVKKSSCAYGRFLPHPGETDRKIKINNSTHVLGIKNISPSAIVQLSGVFIFFLGEVF